MRIGVVTFPGTLDDGDAARAVRLAGGFSYGDYLRCGAIAALTPVMSAVVEAAGKGVPVLGICNGFQILCEAHLLPGALVRNEGQRFVCREQKLAVENADTPWTSGFTRGQVITIPLKNGEGCFQADAETVARLEGEGRVAFRYVGVNPNGSVDDIAGVVSESGNVVGLMPHPEHAVESGFGPGGADGLRSGTDGLTFFTSALESVLA